jgi:uncharacterized protein (DUF1015 family)
LPQLFPFRGLRYTGPSDLSAVTAPPYDVIDDDDRVALERSHPHNAVQLILPRHRAAGDGYQRAARALRDWTAAGVLARDPEPRLYAYRMTFETTESQPRRTMGVIGALGLPDGSGADDVLPHERTLPKARSDRLALLRATRANLDPIWGLSLAAGLTSALGDMHVVSHAVDADGTQHEIAGIDPERVPEIQRIIASAPVVIADGHHRFETARTYHAEHADIPGAGRIMALVVELTEDELCVRPIHRLVHGVPDLRARLAGHVEVEACGAGTDSVDALTARMRIDGALGLVDRQGMALLHLPKSSAAAPLADVPEVLREIDAVCFDIGVRPGLGDVELTYRDDAATCAALVDKGAAEAAVLLQPVSVAQIRAAAIAGVRMPEKTTYFFPKPRTGMVFRELDA